MRTLLTILLSAFCLQLSAATYYVNSSTGADGNNGTSSGTAWQSFSVALGRLSSGDTLNCSGSWNITSTLSCTTANITIEGNGAATLNIDANSIYGELRLSGAGQVFSGFRIANPYSAHNEANALVGITGNGSTVKNMSVYGLGPSTTYDAVVWYVNASGCLFTNVNFWDNDDRDLFRVWGVYNTFTSCLISNCNNPNGNNSPGPHADGWQCWWTGANIWSNVIERCYIVNSDQAIWQLKGTPDNVTCHPGEEGYWTIRNNIVANCESWPVISTDNFRFYNNLIYKSGAGSGPTFIIADTCLNHGRYYNNVFIDCQSTRGANYSSGHNFFTGSTYRWWDSTETISTEAQCQFVNAVAGDFRIGEGSILRGKGTNMISDASMTLVDYSGRLRPSSGAWDLGPYQYASTAGAVSIAVTPPSIDFGLVENGRSSWSALVITNTGTTNVTGAISVSHPFYCTNSSYTAPVASSVTRYIGYSPTNSSLDSANAVVSGGSGAFIPLSGISYPVLSLPAVLTNGVVTSPFTVSGGYVVAGANSDTPGGLSLVAFNVTNSGPYRLLISGISPNTSSDSIWININSEPTADMIWDMPNTNTESVMVVGRRGNGTPTNPQYPAYTFSLSSGANLLYIRSREPGVQLRSANIESVVSNTPPVIAHNPGNIAAQQGLPFSLQVVAAGTEPIYYQWQHDGTNLIATANIQNPNTATLTIAAAASSNAGPYQAIVTNMAGSITSSVAAVTVAVSGTAPVIVTSPSNTTAQVGDVVGFYVTASGTAPMTYFWFKDGVLLETSPNAYYTIDPVGQGDAGAYNVSVSNALGVAVSPSAVLAITNGLPPAVAPQITWQQFSFTVGAGDPAWLLALASGNPAPDFKWFKNGSPLTNSANRVGVSSNRMVILAASAADAGSYHVTASNYLGTATSSQATVTVTNLVTPPAITSNPTNTYGVSGRAAALYVSASGTQPMRWYWFKNGTLDTVQDTPVLSFNPAFTYNSGSYFVVASNASGTATSTVAALAITNAPGPLPFSRPRRPLHVLPYP